MSSIPPSRRWSSRPDSNRRSRRPERRALPDWATARLRRLESNQHPMASKASILPLDHASGMSLAPMVPDGRCGESRTLADGRMKPTDLRGAQRLLGGSRAARSLGMSQARTTNLLHPAASPAGIEPAVSSFGGKRSSFEHRRDGTLSWIRTRNSGSVDLRDVPFHQEGMELPRGLEPRPPD